MVKKFICNGMLGKLCKLMRICGFDTAYTNHGSAILLEAKKENRIVLTRNTRLRSKKMVFFISASKPIEQLENIITEYDLRDEIAPFSRCIACNNKLRAVEKNSIKEKIPFFTYKQFTEFAICPNCQRIYWKGSHYKNMIKNLAHLLSDAG
jgi:uncharacterized protein with PIN domain